MNETYLNLIGHIKNPESQKTLKEEGRFITVEEKNGDLFIKNKKLYIKAL